jgi:hypothetical protein
METPLSTKGKVTAEEKGARATQRGSSSGESLESSSLAVGDKRRHIHDDGTSSFTTDSNVYDGGDTDEGQQQKQQQKQKQKQQQELLDWLEEQLPEEWEGEEDDVEEEEDGTEQLHPLPASPSSSSSSSSLPPLQLPLLGPRARKIAFAFNKCSEEESLRALKKLLVWFKQAYPYYYSGCEVCCASPSSSTSSTSLSSSSSTSPANVSLSSPPPPPPQPPLTDPKGGRLIGMVAASEVEKGHRAGRTELVACPSCGAITRFARFNHVRKARCQCRWAGVLSVCRQCWKDVSVSVGCLLKWCVGVLRRLVGGDKRESEGGKPLLLSPSSKQSF